MQIGNYKLGRYHAILEKVMEDGSFTYETNFISRADLQESIQAINICITEGIICGIATDNPMKIVGMNVYVGAEAIEKLKTLL